MRKALYRYVTAVFAVCLLLVMSLSVEAAATGNGVDWEKGIVRATGTGVFPQNAVSMGQAKAMAIRAAEMDAHLQLAQMVGGINLDSESTMTNYMMGNYEVKERVSTFLKGATIVDQSVDGDTATVTVEMPLYGSRSVAQAALPSTTQKAAFPAPKFPNLFLKENYTGLIVDCRGLGLETAMSPVILSEDGTKLYGYKNLDPDTVIARGMASYVYNQMDESDMKPQYRQQVPLMVNAPRAGSHPLIVKAVKVTGYANKVNPVVSEQDANTILTENAATHFLDKCNVVFVR